MLRIKIRILEIGWGGMDWTGLAQDRDKWRALEEMKIDPQIP
jgi:hypothetical protein